MSTPAEQTLRPELTRGERLLWSGVPRQGLRLRAMDALMIPFSLMWGGFAFFWEFQVISSGAPFFFMLWGIPFVLVGLYIIGGRFFVDARLRSRTWYGLTDQRVIIISGLLGREVKSLSLPSLSDIALSESADGSGSIRLGPASPYPSGAGWPGASHRTPPTLEFIEDARRVHNLLRDAQQAAKRTTIT